MRSLDVRRSGVARLFAVLLTLALFATACGSDGVADIAGDVAGAAGDAADAATDAAGDAADAAGDAAGDAADTAGDAADAVVDAVTDDDDDAMADDAMEDDAMADDAMSMDPVYGGELNYLLEAESDTWLIPGANCAVSCITVMRQVAEPLAIVNEDGEAEPFLLESLEHNDDFTQWTLTMREGVMFHDGTPADGAAVELNLEKMAAGLLQGQVLQDLVGYVQFVGAAEEGVVLIDDMTVQVNFQVPFATFGHNIADRTGYLLSPNYWNDPDNAAAFAIGTGPFKMVEWTRGEVTRLEKNEDYWRADGNGNELPYLDAINFRPNPDVSARRATMEAGDAQANHDSFGENGEFWEGEWQDNGGQMLPLPPAREVTYLMFNNAAPPFDDPEMRRAIAHCSNRDDYIFFRAPGEQLTDVVFPEGGSYTPDVGFPQFDPDEGNAILDRIGRPEVINYGTTNVPSNRETAEFFQDQWTTNCGLNVEIDQFDQSELITKAIGGSFEVFLWRNHGQGAPGLEFVWWHSRHGQGAVALNFGRIDNAELDALMEESWTTTDAAELEKISADINANFADNVYNLWLNVNSFRVVYQENVHGIGVVHTPSGSLAQPTLAGRTWLHEAWIG